MTVFHLDRGNPDDTDDVKDFFSFLAADGNGVVIEGEYAVSDLVEQTLTKSTVLSARPHSLKLADNTIPDGLTNKSMFALKSSSGVNLVMNGLTLDMNRQNQPTPDSNTSLQQSRCLLIQSTGVRGFNDVQLSDFSILNPVGDGVSLSGSSNQSESFGDIHISGFLENERLYSRACVNVTAPFDTCNVSDFEDAAFRVELDYDLLGHDKNVNVNGGSYTNLTLNFKNPLTPGSGVIRNATVTEYAQFLWGTFEIDGCDMTITGERFRLNGSYVIKNGTITTDNEDFSELILAVDGYDLLMEDVTIEFTGVGNKYLFADRSKQDGGQSATFKRVNFSGGTVLLGDGSFTFEDCTGVTVETLQGTSPDVTGLSL